ncbi:MAG: DNA gyrase C-terminal beta-propeller domain-containing protein, partial [Caulobacteraceae bacterium]
EHDSLAEEGEEIGKLLASEKAQWKLVGVGLRDVRKTLAAAPEGPRRSVFAMAPRIEPASAAAAFVLREPITVVLSERGWIRAQRGHIEDSSSLSFKEGDALQIAISASTNDALMVLAADGRAFTLSCDKLPSGRGQGEPLRLLIDLEDRVGIIDAFIHQPGARRALASKAGYGFVLDEDEAISPRKGGKQVINVGGSVLAVSRPAAGDHAAVIGQNGKILIFPLAELPVMGRGKGVKLQSYRQGGLSDLLVFSAEEGANWIDSAGRVCAWPDWRSWLGRRAGAGKLAPRRFPSSKRFRPSRS